MTNISWEAEIKEYNKSDYRTPKEFAETKEYSWSNLYRQAKNLDIKLKTASRVKDVVLSNQDLNALQGHLLGDGSLFYLKPNRKNPVFAVVSKHQEYIEWVNQTIKLMNNRPVWIREQHDDRTNKQYTAYWSRSLSKPACKSLYDRWYKDGVKVIPQDLKLSPELCLRWFMDDGCNNKGAIQLSTDCFTKQEVEFLASLLHSLSIKPTLHKNGNGFRLYIAKQYADTFFQYIGSCPVECFSYKW